MEKEPTSQDSDLEHFIPFHRADLVRMCCEDGTFDPQEHRDFHQFCEIFSAYRQFQSHQRQEALKVHYAPFDPDAEVVLRGYYQRERGQSQAKVTQAFRDMAGRANYRKLSDAELEDSFSKKSLIQVNTDVDLKDFAQVECYVRGSASRKGNKANWFGRKREVDVNIWRRVLLLIKFRRDDETLEDERREDEQIEAAKIYTYLYKNVPKDDLEILFPNVTVSMNLSDKLLLGIPAIGAGVFTLIKIGAQILLLVGVILYLLFDIQTLGADETNSSDLAKLATMALTVLGVIGVFGFKQWTKVKNKRIAFLKEVSDHLFFRSIANNRAVFNRMSESGQEEDVKEAMLLFHQLMKLRKEGRQVDRAGLDEAVERWMKERLGCGIDFDVDDPIDTLKQIRGRCNDGVERALLVEDESGILHVPSLQEAREIIDWIWDNAFSFSSGASGKSGDQAT